MASQTIYGSRKASLALDIIIVGAGIGGCSAAFCLSQAGHRVTIVESAPGIDLELGAGIVLAPNSSRLLQRWGLGKLLDEACSKPQGAAVRRYDNGQLLGVGKWGETAVKEYGTHFHLAHRADIHKMLYDLAEREVTILLNSPVVGCNPGPEAPSVTLKSGKVLKADLIVGADGLKSHIQEVVLGKHHPAESTGDAVYRSLVPAELMLKDPELREFIEDPHLTVWMGPRKHLVAYPIRNGELYNLILSVPDAGSTESWTAQGDLEEMKRDFEGYEPRVKKILGLVKSTMIFRLMDRKPLEKWTHESGRVTLLGDACHPMLPYRAQGSSMAIEDAAVLGNLLSRITHIFQLAPLLKVYQDLRLERTAMAQAASRANQRAFHLADGAEQKERDEALKKRMALEAEGKSASSRSQSVNQKMGPANKADDDKLFGYDADAEVEKWWAS